MGINDNTKAMIDSLAKGDISKAKAFAQCIIAKDNSEKNKHWRDKTSILLRSGNESKLELPLNMSSFCELIKPGSGFNVEQYYLPDAEVHVVDEIITKQQVVRRMQTLGIPVTNTTLLYGDPGTGKTEFAKYIAYMLDKPLLILRFSNLIDSYLGGTGKNIGMAFDFFRQHDIILFLDEIDTVASKRDGGRGCDGEISRTTACIMQELDRLEGGGIIIAATNRKDLLDEALLRRFSIQHKVKCVGENEREKIVEKFWNSIRIPVPFNISEYVKDEKTPSQIHTDMVIRLAQYLEDHPDMTEMELDIKNSIVIPSHWADLFVAVAECINSPDKVCETLEKENFQISRIAEQIPIPEEACVKYGSDAVICYDKRADAIRYSIYLCRNAYKEYYHSDKKITIGELKNWVSQYAAKRSITPTYG